MLRCAAQIPASWPEYSFLQLPGKWAADGPECVSNDWLVTEQEDLALLLQFGTTIKDHLNSRAPYGTGWNLNCDYITNQFLPLPNLVSLTLFQVCSWSYSSVKLLNTNLHVRMYFLGNLTLDSWYCSWQAESKMRFWNSITCLSAGNTNTITVGRWNTDHIHMV